MEHEERNRLIDTYYDGLDADTPEEIVSTFAADVTYRYPGRDAIQGRQAVRAFVSEDRPTSNTTHEVTRRIHGREATACEGHITGQKNGESYQAEFAGFFEFNEDERLITEVAVYSRR